MNRAVTPRLSALIHTGAGVLDGIAVGHMGIGQLTRTFVPWAWLRLLIILLNVAPATVAGYGARTELRRWRRLRQPGKRSSPSSARSLSASRRSCASPLLHLPSGHSLTYRGPKPKMISGPQPDDCGQQPTTEPGSCP